MDHAALNALLHEPKDAPFTSYHQEILADLEKKQGITLLEFNALLYLHQKKWVLSDPEYDTMTPHDFFINGNHGKY